MSVLAALLLLVVALGGRYTLERAGVGAALPDLRIAGVVAGLALLGGALARRRADLPRREGWLIAALLLLGYQAGSALWAPAGARIGDKATDLAVLAALTVAFYLAARSAPVAVARATLWFLLIAALVFAAGALLVTGPGAQGRYAAFGGGPNVFVRIEILGLIAAIGLYRITGRVALLAAVPLLAGTALLSGSRGGLVAALVVGAGALLLTRGRVPKGPAALVAAVAAGLSGLAWLAAPGLVASLEQRFVEQTLKQGYESGRLDIWGSAADLWLGNPVLGAGLDGFYGAVGRTNGVEYPHNYVLGVLAEGGLVGVALLAVAVVLWTRTVRRASPRTELGVAVAGAVFVAVDSLFSGDYYDTRFAWLLAALAAALATATVRVMPVQLRALPGGGRHAGTRPTRRAGLRSVSGPVRSRHARHAATEARR